MKRKHVGSTFDDFLKEEGILSEVQATAAKRVIAYQITQEMKKRKLTKSEFAIRRKLR